MVGEGGGEGASTPPPGRLPRPGRPPQPPGGRALLGQRPHVVPAAAGAKAAWGEGLGGQGEQTALSQTPQTPSGRGG